MYKFTLLTGWPVYTEWFHQSSGETVCNIVYYDRAMTQSIWSVHQVWECRFPEPWDLSPRGRPIADHEEYRHCCSGPLCSDQSSLILSHSVYRYRETRCMQWDMLDSSHSTSSHTVTLHHRTLCSVHWLLSQTNGAPSFLLILVETLPETWPWCHQSSPSGQRSWCSVRGVVWLCYPFSTTLLHSVPR